MVRHLPALGGQPQVHQVFRRVTVARPTDIFAKLPVQDSMRLIFDAPVPARGGRKPISIRERAQEVATFRAGWVADDPDGFHPADGWEASPVRFRLQPIHWTADGITSDLDPAVVFLEGFLDRQASAGHFGIEPESDVFAQGRRVILQGQHLIRPALDDR